MTREKYRNRCWELIALESRIHVHSSSVSRSITSGCSCSSQSLARRPWPQQPGTRPDGQASHPAGQLDFGDGLRDARRPLGFTMTLWRT